MDLKLLSLLLVSSGTLLLIGSLYFARYLCLEIRANSTGWNAIYVLVLAFIASYLVFINYILNESFHDFHVVIAAVFFGGGGFVLLVIRFSVSAIRKEEEIAEQALRNALHDQLTSLPNRTLLEEHIGHAIQLGHRSDEPFAVLLLDLDRFKDVNDTLGHHVGDKLLQLIGPRIAGCVRASDTVARLGGDEFAILLEGLGVEQAATIAQKIAAEIDEPFLLDDRALHVGSSIGIALYPEHGGSAATLLQHADVAMYQAKRNELEFAVYDVRDDENTLNRLELVWALREAFKRQQFQLLYQPKLDLGNSSVIGAEALIRWYHPEHGQVAPDIFVPVAEQMGLMKVLTLWVVKSAAEQMARWREDGVEINVAINISVRNLNDPRFPQQVRDILRRYAIPATWLTLEITEGSMMIDPEMARRSLQALANLGLRLSIDDFGTGYSSLAYLKHLPCNEVKIDKSFVSDIDENEDDASIVCATIDLAHNLGYRVVAEGVENRDVLDLLTLLHCDQVQGYYVSAPLDPKQMALFARCHQPSERVQLAYA